MNEATYEKTLSLLKPLTDAGWDFEDVDDFPEDLVIEDGPFIFLERSSFHLGIGLDLEGKVTLYPSAEMMETGYEEVGAFDVLAEPVSVGDLGGLDEASFGVAIDEMGLTEPTRIPTSGALSPEAYKELMGDFFALYVYGQSTAPDREKLFEDPDFKLIMRTLPLMSLGSVPDPIPRIAALGIAQCCWRNTALEDLHSQDNQLNDAQMAKLTIATTRSVATYVSREGVDWNGVTSVLLDPTRTAGRDGHSVLELIDGEQGWNELQGSVQEELDKWQRFEKILGREAILRLLTLEGATYHTDGWWGNGGWAKLVREVFPNARLTSPEAFPEDSSELDALEVQLIEQPEDVSEEIMYAMIDAYPGPSLRAGTAKAAHAIPAL